MSISKREANKINTRRRILKASRRLFKEKGYENTMIEEVAEKADISKATLYKYFPSKESLLEGTMDEQIAACEVLIKEWSAGGSSYEKIETLLRFLVSDSVPFIDISRRLLYLNATTGSNMYGKIEPVKKIFRNLIDEGKKEGIFRPNIDTETIVELIMGVYLESQFAWIDMGEDSQNQWGEKAVGQLELTLKGCILKNERK